ncbi:hypothetical protein B0H14DRAFT_3886547 [Mycena olivaceomarginata]|nr:hypothetical protein B0H14DRAFT_3886547 [Mycena olivaceomarginata]
MYLSTKLLAYVPLAIIAATAKPTGAEASETVGIRSELSIHPEALAVGTGCTGFQLSGDCSTLAVTRSYQPMHELAHESHQGDYLRQDLRGAILCISRPASVRYGGRVHCRHGHRYRGFFKYIL